MPRALTLSLILLMAAATAMAQDAIIRACTYNVLNYPGSTGDQRNPEFELVIDEIDPDLIVAQELTTPAASVQFLEEVLDPSVWSVNDPTYVGSSDEYLYYKHDLLDVLSVTSIQTALRNIELYEVQLLTVPGEPVLWISNAHLKASQGGTNEQLRLAEVMEFIDYMDANDLHFTDLLFCGDLNVYTSSEPAYQALLNDGEFEDPIDSPGNWHNNASFADVHTQSPRTENFGGGATGGMDDRFDFILAQPPLFDGEGWEIMDGTYTAFGNDGNHFNDAINDGTNGVVSAEVADAIHNASDHLPVFVDVGYYSSGAVTFAVTPAVPEPVIFPSGGLVEYNVLLASNADQTLQGQAWTVVTLPNGNEVGPLVLVPLTLTPGAVIDTDQTLDVPGWAPGGTYEFAVRLGYYPSIVALSDGFAFSKLGGVGTTAGLGEYWRGGDDPWVSGTPEVVREFELNRTYPNPFNGATTVEMTLPEAVDVRITVFDVTGRTVLDRRIGEMPAGRHGVSVDLSEQASGLYLIQVSAGEAVASSKAMLIR